MKNLIFGEERAQVSFEYLLTAAFAIMLAISAAIIVEALKSLALQAQADLLSTRAKVIENIFTN
jgi:uncharacterized protein (UPF0333 family)